MALSDTIILIISVIILIVAGVFNILAAQKLSGSTDPNFLKARSELIWAAVIIFIGLFFIIIMYGVSFYFSRQAISQGVPNTISKGGKMTLIIMIIIAFILIIVSGVLSIMASLNLRKSSNFASNGASGKAYNYSIAAAITSIVGMTITLLIYLILIFIRKPSIVQAAGVQYAALKKRLGGTSTGAVIIEQEPVAQLGAAPPVVVPLTTPAVAAPVVAVNRPIVRTPMTVPAAPVINAPVARQPLPAAPGQIATVPPRRQTPLRQPPPSAPEVIVRPVPGQS